jgi:uncharacterized protein (DUF488 family)
MTTVYTVGHSTRALEDFLALLREGGIEVLVDVRQYPGSRRYPHFGREPLARSLAEAGIEYRHLPALGGRRPARKDSPNTAWRNEAFRGYADYMETGAFCEGIAELLEIAAKAPTAIMCSEAVWWRCHRSLISDYLKSTGVEVIHLMGPGSREAHPYTAAARIVDGHLSYRGEDLFSSEEGAP